MLYSFDIFDTCFVRKCGVAENLFDVLSYSVFVEEVKESDRQEFVARRKAAERSLWERNDYGLEDIYEAFEFDHPALCGKSELVKLELECEERMILPVVEMRDFIDQLRLKKGQIAFVSDMYLPKDFILSLLIKHGFYRDGDKLYVSNHSGCMKLTGDLYRLIQKKENVSFSHWEHWGDNRISDYSVPKKLGIRSHHIVQKHTPYPEQWNRNSHSLGVDYAGMLAGLSKAMRCSMGDSLMRDIALDIIAPFYCSFVYRVLSDAVKRGIRRLYFCARDTYQLFQIAKRMSCLFPSVELNYLYISKKALYHGDALAKMKYFEQIGLASQDEIAVVDIRSSGYTLYYLNQLLEENHYKKVRGYYFELFTDNRILYDIDNYYCEINSAYHFDKSVNGMIGCWHLYESFFSLNQQKRTIDYAMGNGVASPVFAGKEEEDEECMKEVNESLCENYTQLLLNYVDCYVELRLMKYSDKIFEEIVIPTFLAFFRFPEKHYLLPLQYFYGFHWSQHCFVPYVKKESILSLLKTKGRDTMWRKGTIVASLPYGFVKLLHSLRAELSAS